MVSEVFPRFARIIREEGREEGKWEVVDNVLNQGGDLEYVASISGFTVEEIKEHRNSKQ